MTYELDTYIIWGGGATRKNPFLFQNRKMGFFNVGLFWVFYGLNLKNDIIFILYLKSKDSATHVFRFLNCTIAQLSLLSFISRRL